MTELPLLSPDEQRRYSRTILLPGMGMEAQQRLLASSVLVLGSGALGSIVSMYLAASGVGTIGIADFDNIDISNLQRQLSFTTADIGMSKVETTAAKLQAINPGITVNIHEGLVREKLARSLFPDYDLVVEGSDNPNTKYLVTDLCTELGIPYVLGGISEFRGQIMSWAPGHHGYRDIFPEGAPIESATPCGLGGILGPVPGTIGSMQASEVIKILTGVGQPLFGRMLTFNALNMTFQTFTF